MLLFAWLVYGLEHGATIRVVQRLFRHVTFVATLALTLGSLCLSVSAQEVAAKQVSAKVVCGSHSADPKRLPPFEFTLQFNVKGSLWISERTTPQPGKERFLGILSPSGTMLVVGEGKLDDGSTWSYEFSGHKKSNGLTILTGRLQSEKPKGSRSCSLAF